MSVIVGQCLSLSLPSLCKTEALTFTEFHEELVQIHIGRNGDRPGPPASFAHGECSRVLRCVVLCALCCVASMKLRHTRTQALALFFLLNVQEPVPRKAALSWRAMASNQRGHETKRAREIKLDVGGSWVVQIKAQARKQQQKHSLHINPFVSMQGSSSQKPRS